MPDKPWLTGLPHDDTYWEVRAGRAEAEVERLRGAIEAYLNAPRSYEIDELAYRQEYEIAEVLRLALARSGPARSPSSSSSG